MTSARELSSLPLPPHHIHKLTKAGYLSVEDIEGVTPTELSEDLSLSREDALSILQVVRKPQTPLSEKEKAIKTISAGSPRSRSALELLQQEQTAGSIVTFCEQLDDMLGGGVPTCKITEFCGAPGIGKTQIGMQLAVDVQIPEEFGGLDGEVIYIDTEGSFIVERVADIAAAAIKHLENVTESADLDESERNLQLEAMKEFEVEKILSRIHVFRCHDYIQLIALSHLLHDFIKERIKVKLVVVDSIAFHFRHDFEDMALRTRLLNGLAQSFIRMACEQQLAVVLMNQMTTKIQQNQDGGSHLVPALGESWSHASTVRVVLHWDNKQRMATLYKSPTKQEMTVPFQITSCGVRDAWDFPPPAFHSSDNDEELKTNGAAGSREQHSRNDAPEGLYHGKEGTEGTPGPSSGTVESRKRTFDKIS
ncbi:DNA repair protein RAD51 homolog 3 [Nematostella vectensis]|uniref:DNA repair protein RAD51 homolog 3 n=1 Tax=Nematostella vectensis TaxID=45351 RepID=UPI0020775B24|nr:DNA repair protein RAD51 homolog 3 [Nematostella vectensis]